MNLRAPALLLLLATPALAASPDDYAWQWPLQAGDGDAFVVELDAPVYARLQRADLRDLAAFNADGQPIPLAPLPARTVPPERSEAVAWLRVPEAPASGVAAESLSLRVQRDADGRLRDLQLDAGGAPAAATANVASRELLVDLGEEPPSVQRLRVAFAPGLAEPVDLRVDVSASADLAQWRPLGAGLALVRIVDNGVMIERLDLGFAPSRERYLKLSLAGDGDWPALARIERVYRETDTPAPTLASVELQGVPEPDQPGTFRYTSPGPLPVERIELDLAQANSVASVQLLRRDRDDAGWYGATSFTAFRMGRGEDEARSLPVSVPVSRDRQWRLQTLPALAEAPRLTVHYVPDRLVLLAQGPAPYVLAAGSARATREDYPLAAALAARGGTEPAIARLGPGREAGGEAVLAPDRGPEHRRWTLWAILLAGAAVVAAMAWRVLRSPAA